MRQIGDARCGETPPVDYDALLAETVAGSEEIDAGSILQQIRQHPKAPEEVDTDAVARAVQTAVEQGTLGLMRHAEDATLQQMLRFQETVPLSVISFGPDVIILSKARAEEIRGGVKPPPPPPPPPNGRYHHVRLVIRSIPASRIGDVNRGIFIPLSAAVDDPLTFTMEIDVTSKEGITKETLENKIKETIRQIGAQVEEEEKE